MTMEKHQIDQLAAAYITEYLTHERADDGAWDAIESLIGTDAQTAWAVIERVLELPFPDIYLAWVGAGPIEELLAHYPMMFAERAIARARVDPLPRSIAVRATRE